MGRLSMPLVVKRSGFCLFVRAVVTGAAGAAAARARFSTTATTHDVEFVVDLVEEV